jgi:ornithine--oxo-acid transaminase
MFSTNLAKNYKTLTMYSEKIIIRYAKGVKFYDMYHNSYIDATSSYCSANLGHQNPHLKRMLINQLDKIAVCPRYVENGMLNRLSTTVNKFFNNKINLKQNQYLQILPSSNGVDTLETAIKLARAWGTEKKGIPLGKTKQIFMNNNFHGRTLAAISANNSFYQNKFYPRVPNLINMPYNDIDALNFCLEHYNNYENVSAIFVEPIQCEGGINIPDFDYLFNLRKLCDKYNILLVCDEIQTGLFRTGNLLSSEKFNIKPDIVLLGKSLGGGYLPVSICIASNNIMSCIKEGEHGSTFGGNPLASFMAEEVLEYLHKNNYKQIVDELGIKYFRNLKLLQDKFKFIKEIRGIGLLFGIELDSTIDVDKICNKLTEYNILIKSTKNNTIRFSPPFIINQQETEELFNGFYNCFKKI